MNWLKSRIDEIFPTQTYEGFSSEEAERLIEAYHQGPHITLADYYKGFNVPADTPFLNELSTIAPEHNPFAGIFILEGINPGHENLMKLNVPAELKCISSGKLESVRTTFFQEYLRRLEKGPGAMLRFKMRAYLLGQDIIEFISTGEGFEPECTTKLYEVHISRVYHEIRDHIERAVPEMIEGLTVGYFLLWNDSEWVTKLIRKDIKAGFLDKARGCQTALLERVKNPRGSYRVLGELISELGL
jgi:hypothetical protein